MLRWFGLTLIRVETAGGGGQHSNNMMSMIGIENAEEFKIMILNQREKIIKEKNQHSFAAPITTSATGINLNDKFFNIRTFNRTERN